MNTNLGMHQELKIDISSPPRPAHLHESPSYHPVAPHSHCHTDYSSPSESDESMYHNMVTNHSTSHAATSFQLPGTSSRPLPSVLELTERKLLHLEQQLTGSTTGQLQPLSQPTEHQQQQHLPSFAIRPNPRPNPPYSTPPQLQPQPSVSGVSAGGVRGPPGLSPASSNGSTVPPDPMPLAAALKGGPTPSYASTVTTGGPVPKRSCRGRPPRQSNSPKPFPCGYCTLGFRQKTQLQQHERVHTGERPYPCIFCGRAFKQLSHKIQHERIHTGEKPYNCVECGKKFRQKNHLDSHFRSHTMHAAFRIEDLVKLEPPS